ncbi:hypothetical protein [Sphingobium sp. B12D2B]|nr:hypothetical protein [Sphingobium sp. B12D2B]MCW2349807.1 hypothetical protein [Sphingobium sp. B12D2B]
MTAGASNREKEKPGHQASASEQGTFILWEVRNTAFTVARLGPK